MPRTLGADLTAQRVNIGDLRTIGTRVLDAIRSDEAAETRGRIAGVGAGGDKTYGIDVLAEKIIISSLDELDEPLTIISEEAGIVPLHGGGSTVVLIDPIDGSKNAVAGIPFYGISIAVAKGPCLGNVFLSYIMNLANGDVFTADPEAGARMNGQTVRTQQDDAFSVIAYEAPSPSRDIPKIIPLLSRAHKVRCLGAIALDLAYLSSGGISVFITASPSRSFDFAAGWFLANVAGGTVTDLEGNPLDNTPLGLKKSVPILAAGNQVLHRRARAVLAGDQSV